MRGVCACDYTTLHYQSPLKHCTLHTTQSLLLTHSLPPGRLGVVRAHLVVHARAHIGLAQLRLLKVKRKLGC